MLIVHMPHRDANTSTHMYILVYTETAKHIYTLLCTACMHTHTLTHAHAHARTHTLNTHIRKTHNTQSNCVHLVLYARIPIYVNEHTYMCVLHLYQYGYFCSNQYLIYIYHVKSCWYWLLIWYNTFTVYATLKGSHK